MRRNASTLLIAFVALAGLAACGDNDADVGDNAQVTDTLISQDTTTVEMPVTVPDTAAVITSVDTAKDTVDIGPR